MNIPVSVWISLLVATVLLVVVVGRATRSWGVVGALVGWGAVVAVLIGTGVLGDDPSIRFPALGALFTLPVVGGVVAYRLSGRLRALVASADLRWMTAAHATRVLFGSELLVVAGLGALPWHFSAAAGLGDIVAGVAAPFVAAWAVARRGPSARASIIIFTLYGLLDLVTAIASGVLSSSTFHVISVAGQPSTDAMANLPLAIIPAYAVPILVLLHIGTLARVYQPAWRGSSSPAPSAST